MEKSERQPARASGPDRAGAARLPTDYVAPGETVRMNAVSRASGAGRTSCPVSSMKGSEQSPHHGRRYSTNRCTGSHRDVEPEEDASIEPGAGREEKPHSACSFIRTRRGLFKHDLGRDSRVGIVLADRFDSGRKAKPCDRRIDPARGTAM
ncbi:hypothetical protein [Burkholderia alba]|uniref:hypothetical protein n=1 Tax=Burkholderia alba TaxID=2683677 RepID=UPI002B05DC37|nr:hypothetical protein [Burkholderia alba]